MEPEAMQAHIGRLKADIESMEQALALRDVAGPGLEEDITRHLLTESAGLVGMLLEGSTDDAADDEEGDIDDVETLETQIAGLARLSGIEFSKVEAALMVEQGVRLRRIELQGRTSGLAFALVTDVKEGTTNEAPRIVRCDLNVPLEVQAELAGFIKRIAQDCVLTVALQGLAKFAHASQQRQRLFEKLQSDFPAWICLPHGSLATPLLSMRPPAGVFVDLVFDFFWQMEVSPTGALEHTAALVPHVTQEFVDADKGSVLAALPTEFKRLTQLKGLQGALEIMMAVVAGGSSQQQ